MKRMRREKQVRERGKSEKEGVVEVRCRRNRRKVKVEGNRE